MAYLNQYPNGLKQKWVQEKLFEVYPNPFYNNTNLYVNDPSGILSIKIISVDHQMADP